MADFADPHRRVLVAVDMESYSVRDNVLQYRAQQALQKIMQSACDEAGLDRAKWRVQQGGDGQLAILPAGTSERVVATRLTPLIDRLLREHNRGLAPEARVRLRLAVHEGPVHLDGANGYPGDAVVDVCRLVDSPQLKNALRRFPGAEAALIVSDRIYQDVVRHYQDLRPEHFLRVMASLPDKKFEAPAWIYVPGENAAGRRPMDHERLGQAEDHPDDGTVNRRDRPVPGTAGGGQVFHNITSHGPTAYGNGNIVSTNSPQDIVDPRWPRR
ncbi:hypothetical protein GCM10022225_82020 [Plantactinospora mayteni]|uniref:Guanylate cyclase domain-containing protein n=2 Tax=Plantactinospora mayteni TaxID=566021 RepID=A0ABQ4F3Y1_9ACTN|nr:hypothetical protein Pma05_81910 [Plantactinospora mayteni]